MRRRCPGGRGRRSPDSSASPRTSARSRSTRRSPCWIGPTPCRATARAEKARTCASGPVSSGWPAVSRKPHVAIDRSTASVRGARQAERDHRLEPGDRGDAPARGTGWTRRKRSSERCTRRTRRSVKQASTRRSAVSSPRRSVTSDDTRRPTRFAEKGRTLAAEDDFASQGLWRMAQGAGARRIRRVRGGAPARRRGGRRSSREPTTSSSRATATRSGARCSRRRPAATTRARRYEEAIARYERKGNVVAAARVRAQLERVGSGRAASLLERSSISSTLLVITRRANTLRRPRGEGRLPSLLLGAVDHPHTLREE